MKVALILTTLFIIFIPAGILLGWYYAAGSGFSADCAPSQEKESETLVEPQTL